MSHELLNTVAALGTFTVITATAIAAIIQLRHMRGSNQIVALTECRETLESDAFRKAQLFITHELPRILADPERRIRLLESPLPADLQDLTYVGNFFENMGTFVSCGIIDRDIALSMWRGVILRTWTSLQPVTAIVRQRAGTPATWEHFEYIAALSEDFIAKHPRGTYPKKMRRMQIDAKWQELASSMVEGKRP